MIFFDQLKVPTIKFGKCFAEFMIPITLLKKFVSSEFSKSADYFKIEVHWVFEYKPVSTNYQ